MPTPIQSAVDAHTAYPFQRKPLDTLDVDLTDYQQVIFDIYERQANDYRIDFKPHRADLILSYEAFMNELAEQWAYLLSRGFVFEFVDDDPNVTGEGFKSAAETFAEFNETGVLRVFRSAGDHEFLDQGFIWYNGRNETLNTIFRAVHDVLGHFASGGSFGWAGETKAYYSHAKLFSRMAHHALFSETCGQQAYYAITGDYAPQVGVWYSEQFFGAPIK
jgi:hypothetical protein